MEAEPHPLPSRRKKREILGDRANVVVEQTYYEVDANGIGGPPIYLYTHWGGSALPDTLLQALKLQDRWDDEAYLARIIFKTMGAGGEGTTGFGISASPPDNEYPYLRVDCKNQTVTVDYNPVRQYQDHPNLEIPFKEYIKLKSPTWEKLEKIAKAQKKSTAVAS